MKKVEIHPFANESESVQLGELTIENRTDRVSIYGSIDLTKDKQGLESVRALKEIIDRTVAELEKVELPEKVRVLEPDKVANPFE